jgi:hypothetical protein
VSDGTLNTIIDATGSDAIRAGGGINRLSAERSSDVIMLAINDIQVGTLPAAESGNPVTAGLVAATYLRQSIGGGCSIRQFPLHLQAVESLNKPDRSAKEPLTTIE